jgi:hypothetical protein
LALALRSPDADSKNYPERQVVRKRQAAQKRSMRKAELITALVGIAAVGALLIREE